jgi:predicted transglutaminase-like cysteine proteinase
MLSIARGCGTFGAALCFLLCAEVSTVDAKLRKQAAAPSPVVGMVPALPAPIGGPARFFTINQVLAKQQGRPAPSHDVRMAALELRGTISDGPSLPAARMGSSEPFGMHAFRAPQGALWVKWREIEAKLLAEGQQIAACRADPEACSLEASRLLRMVEAAAARSGRARYELVNQRVNAAVRYTSDLAQHGVLDLWSSPLETLASGRGDCEDYAIAKYAILREAGVAADDLRIVLLRDTQTREAHAVLAARDQGRWYILDNRRLGFYVDGDLPHYLPLFALNHEGVKLFAAPYAVHERAPADASPAATDTGGGRGDMALL